MVVVFCNSSSNKTVQKPEPSITPPVCDYYWFYITILSTSSCAIFSQVTLSLQGSHSFNTVFFSKGNCKSPQAKRWTEQKMVVSKQKFFFLCDSSKFFPWSPYLVQFLMLLYPFDGDQDKLFLVVLSWLILVWFLAMNLYSACIKSVLCIRIFINVLFKAPVVPTAKKSSSLYLEASYIFQSPSLVVVVQTPLFSVSFCLFIFFSLFHSTSLLQLFFLLFSILFTMFLEK